MPGWLRLELISCNAELISVKHNNITELRPYVMQRFNVLKSLDISNNKVRTLEGSLSRNRKLILFLADDNMLGGDRGFQGALRGAFVRNRKLRFVSLRRNKIVKLSSRLAHKKNQLMELHLGENQIKRVYSRTFALLGKLEQLGLHGNKMFFVHKDAFVHNRKLQQLDLCGNLIRFVGKNRPLNLRNNQGLIDLLLTDNKLESISEIDMSRCKQLEHLDLAFNRIQRIQENDLSNKTELAILNISFNHIQEIDPASFSTLLNLHTLDLSKNQLTSIHHQTFSNLPNLQVLSLAYNSLTAIAENTFIRNGRLVALDLKSNLLLAWQPATIYSNINMRYLDLQENQFAVNERYFADHGTHFDVGDWASDFHDGSDEDEELRNIHVTLNKRVFARLQCLRLSNNTLAFQAVGASQKLGVQFYAGSTKCQVRIDNTGHVFRCGCSAIQLRYMLTAWMIK
ncbi:uncharacterized protein LOC104265410 [Ciona intestinalis]